MGAVRLRNAAMPYLEKSKNPSFIAVSSVSGVETDGFFEGYGAMKAALNFFMKGEDKLHVLIRSREFRMLMLPGFLVCKAAPASTAPKASASTLFPPATFTSRAEFGATRKSMLLNFSSPFLI